MGESKAILGWYPVGNVWLPIICDATGRLIVDLTNIDLCDIGDVNCVALANLNLLQWNAAAGEWQNVTPGAVAGAIDLDDLADVNVAGVANQELIWWNAAAGEWQRVTPGALGGAINLDDLGDVGVPIVVNNDIIYWNVGAGEWRNISLPNFLTTLLTARGDILRMGAAIAERYALGAQFQDLQAGANDPEWHYEKEYTEDWRTLDRYTTVLVGTGATSVAFYDHRILTGGGLGGSARLYTGRSWSIYTGPHVFRTIVSGAGWVLDRSTIYLTFNTQTAGVPVDADNGFGWKVINGVIWAWNGNGVNFNLTNTGISLVGAWGRRTLLINYRIPAGEINYYVDDVLRATHNTFLTNTYFSRHDYIVSTLAGAQGLRMFIWQLFGFATSF